MAIILKNFNQYWQTKSATDKKLIQQKPKQQAVSLNYPNRVKEVQTAIIEPPEPEEVIEERACILASDIGLPFEWAETIVKLRNMERPKSIPTSSWEEVETRPMLPLQLVLKVKVQPKRCPHLLSQLHQLFF